MALQKGYYKVRENLTLESHDGERVTISQGDAIATNGKVIGRLVDGKYWKDLKVKITPEVEQKLAPKIGKPQQYSEIGAPLKARPNLDSLGIWMHMQQDSRESKAPNKTWDPKSDAYKPKDEPKEPAKAEEKPKAKGRKKAPGGPSNGDKPQTPKAPRKPRKPKAPPKEGESKEDFLREVGDQMVSNPNRESRKTHPQVKVRSLDWKDQKKYYDSWRTKTAASRVIHRFLVATSVR